MKKNIKISILLVVILGTVIFIYNYFSRNKNVSTRISGEIAKTNFEVTTENKPISALGEPNTSSGVNASQNTNTSPTKSEQKSFAYLFEEKREPNTSNIVGYFGGGAFAWYVPDWLVSNWEMKQFRGQGMTFAPKILDNIEDVSGIIFDVSTSTELLNAENLAYTQEISIPKNEIIINEILLNNHAGDVISIQMETNTRIYHIVAYTRDFRRITDMYFMNGNGKTLQVTFEAKAEYFPQFSDKIRNLVEGIGELKLPQG